MHATLRVTHSSPVRADRNKKSDSCRRTRRTRRPTRCRACVGAVVPNRIRICVFGQELYSRGREAVSFTQVDLIRSATHGKTKVQEFVQLLGVFRWGIYSTVGFESATCFCFFDHACLARDFTCMLGRGHPTLHLFLILVLRWLYGLCPEATCVARASSL